MSTRLTGTVKWFNASKGFGFIAQDGGPDVFVHHTAIVMEGYRQLVEGQRVEFQLEDNGKGPRASKVISLEENGKGSHESTVAALVN